MDRKSLVVLKTSVTDETDGHTVGELQKFSFLLSEVDQVRAHVLDGGHGIPLGADKALVRLFALRSDVGPGELTHELLHR